MHRLESYDVIMPTHVYERLKEELELPEPLKRDERHVIFHLNPYQAWKLVEIAKRVHGRERLAIWVVVKEPFSPGMCTPLDMVAKEVVRWMS